MSDTALASDAVRASKKPIKNADADTLETWIRYFEEAETASRQARFLAERARDYYDGAQWTEDELAVLRARHQPPSVNNLIKGKIDTLLGMERRGRSDPKAFPRTPDEDMRADAATQVLRYIADDNRYDVVRSSVFDNMLIEGVGGVEVIAEPDDVGQGYAVRINHIPWERIFYDPHSSHPGFSDASYLGIVIWMDRDDALAMYPGREDVLEATFSSVADTGTYEDRPNTWCDSRRRRVRMVQMHHKRGQDWWTGTFTRGGFVHGPVVSPYLDRHGRPTCPLILRSCYVDRHNNRYGVVRDMIPRQDAINKTESKLQHMLSVNQIVMEEGAVEDVDKARREAAKPDGVMVHAKNFEFRVNRDSGAVQGQFERLQYQIAQMRDSGPNASMQGKDPRELSGRAIIAQQAGGQVEHEPIADALRQHSHKVFEAAWMRARQFMTAPKVLAITENEQDVRFISLNNPVTLGDDLQRLAAAPPTPGDPRTGQQKAQQVIAQMGIQGPSDPRLQTVLRVENDLDGLDVKIMIEEGPDTPNLQYEQWQAFTQLPQEVLANFPPEIFIKMNPGLKDKDQFLQMLAQHQAQQAQGQAQQHAMQMQLAEANLATAKAAAADKMAQARDRQAQTVERMHHVTKDYAATIGAAVVPAPDPMSSPDVATMQPNPAPAGLLPAPAGP